ncbi:MAG: sugar transferase [Rhodobacteraceae bacterium]|nr:MAG: sugar transferase [Paracoccaceae bacterium]
MFARALYQARTETPLDLGSAERATTYAARPGMYRTFGKRMFDLGMLAVIAPLVVPIIAVVTLILMVQGHSPFYSQQRVGRGGRTFRLWKFRTMQPDAETVLHQILANNPDLQLEWERTQKLKQDPRVTTFGQYLRRTSIDELPQLLNVLFGQMSFLGPRPMLPEQQYLYGPALPVYTSLRPGISGFWQVSERNEAHFQRRAELDMDYARDLSFLTDLKLVARTLRTVWYSTGY